MIVLHDSDDNDDDGDNGDENDSDCNDDGDDSDCGEDDCDGDDDEEDSDCGDVDGDGDDDGDDIDDDGDGNDGPEGFFCLASIAPLIVLSTQQGSTNVHTRCSVTYICPIYNCKETLSKALRTHNVYCVCTYSCSVHSSKNGQVHFLLFLHYKKLRLQYSGPPVSKSYGTF